MSDHLGLDFNLETDDEGPTYIDWDFRPYNPVRDYNPDTGHFRLENVFIRCWQKIMTQNAVDEVKGEAIMREDQWFVENESWRYPILDVFDPYTPSTHQTRIASNFILFLGQGLGQSYIDSAEKLSEIFAQAHKSKPEAYLAQWALTNNPSDRHGLISFPPREISSQTDQGDAFFSPNYDDLKTLERAAYWCGTETGQTFLYHAQKIATYLGKRYDRMAPQRFEARKQRTIKTLKR